MYKLGAIFDMICSPQPEGMTIMSFRFWNQFFVWKNVDFGGVLPQELALECRRLGPVWLWASLELCFPALAGPKSRFVGDSGLKNGIIVLASRKKVEKKLWLSFF